MLKKHNLEIFDHKFNKTNGGSSQYYICHKNSNFQIDLRSIPCFNKISDLLENPNKLEHYQKKFSDKTILIIMQMKIQLRVVLVCSM